MCGILGAVATAPEDLPDSGAFGRALDRLAHRGPDGHGVFHDHAAMLGHRRLSIVDLSAAGQQPMVSADERFVIVYNGEVYNHHALREELERDGQALRSRCDTEVLLELYARRGTACLERLRGMFALAVWDRREQELVLARDRLGIKPLYYWAGASQLAFGSELRALGTLPGVPCAPSIEAIHGYLTWGSVPQPHTMLRDVHELPPGSVLRWKQGKLTTRRWWSLSPAQRHATRDEALEVLRPTLREAVRLRCIADVPLGAFLSGGIDSSAIVGLMRAAGHSDLRTLSIVFPGTRHDEARFAQQSPRRYETSHTELEATDGMVGDLLDAFFDALDQPTIDGLNSFVVSRLARAAGLTVALSGLGGDEVFGGYTSFRRASALAPWLERVPQGLRAGAARVGSRLHPRLAKIDAFALPGSVSEQSYRATRGLFSRRQVDALLEASPLRAEPSRTPYEGPLPTSPFHAIMGLELGGYMHNQLLRDSDVFGMASAVEIRVPLIDHEVVEVVAATPAELVMAGSHKALLRDALPHPLPPACVERPKMGFTFPFDSWLKTRWRGDVEAQLLALPDALVQLMRPAQVRAVWEAYLAGTVHWSRPWAIYVLARWFSNDA